LRSISISIFFPFLAPAYSITQAAGEAITVELTCRAHNILLPNAPGHELSDLLAFKIGIFAPIFFCIYLMKKSRPVFVTFHTIISTTSPSTDKTPQIVVFVFVKIVDFIIFFLRHNSSARSDFLPILKRRLLSSTRIK